MTRIIISYLLLLSSVLLIASCGGETITQTLTQTQTLNQTQTITETETLTQSPVTQTIEVTTTIITSEQQNETTTTAGTSPDTAKTTTTTTTSTSTAFPTTITETQVPPDYTTYTSEGLFSISYPSDWELLNYTLEDLEIMVQDLLTSIDSGLPLNQVSYIFAAGLPTDLGWEPSANIVVESLPFPVSSLDEAVDAEIAGIRAFVDVYMEIYRTNMLIGGIEATIIYWEGIMGMDNLSNLQMYMLLDDIVWIVTCTPPPGEYDQWEEEFSNILFSFRYLK